MTKRTRSARWLVAAVLLLSTAVAPLPALAGEPAKVPSGWRDLRFGMTEAQVAAAVKKMRTRPQYEWEKTSGTYAVGIDLGGGRIVKMDADASRIQHWMITGLDDGTGTLRAWFDHGKLFAVQALSYLTQPAFVEKAGEAYGGAPETRSLTYADETSGNTDPSKPLETAIWKGKGSTAVIYQSTGFGPELLVFSDAGMAALLKLHAKDPHGAGVPAPTKAEKSTKF